MCFQQPVQLLLHECQCLGTVMVHHIHRQPGRGLGVVQGLAAHRHCLGREQEYIPKHLPAFLVPLSHVMREWFQNHDWRQQRDCAEFCAACLFPSVGVEWGNWAERGQIVAEKKHSLRCPMQLHMPGPVAPIGHAPSSFTVQALVVSWHEDNLCMHKPPVLCLHVEGHAGGPCKNHARVMCPSRNVLIPQYVGHGMQVTWEKCTIKAAVNRGTTKRCSRSQMLSGWQKMDRC